MEGSSVAETARLRREAERYNPFCRILALVFTVVAGAGVCTILLLIYIFAMHNWRRQGAAFKTTVDLNYFATISQAVTTVILRTVPLVVSLHAYQLAAEWLEASRQGCHDVGPSPSQ